MYNTILKIYKLPEIKEQTNTTILPTLRRVKLSVRADGTYKDIEKPRRVHGGEYIRHDDIDNHQKNIQTYTILVIV
jgi:hypothetical protein